LEDGYETYFNLRLECGELEELKLREKVLDRGRCTEYMQVHSAISWLTTFYLRRRR